MESGLLGPLSYLEETGRGRRRAVRSRLKLRRRLAARFWREQPERLALEEGQARIKMDLRGNTARLHWMMTLVALALATVAAQSPLF